MDRWVLLVALLGSAVLVACGAIFLLGDYLNPVFVNGAATASRIDDTIGNTIAARFPDASVGAAHCPILLNLTGKRTGRCALPIAGSEMPVEVATSYFAGGAPPLRNVGALFVTRDAERTIAARLAGRYGEQFDVRCPGAAVRVVANGTTVTCFVEAPDVLRRGVEVTVSGADGDVRAEELGGIATAAARVFGREIAERTEGSVTIPGAAMERYLRGAASEDAHGEVGRRGLVGTAHCPPHIVLHEGGRATCTVRVGGLPLTYDVHFEKGPGLYVQAQKRIEVVALLREIGIRYFERAKYTGGKPLLVRVDCGAASVVFVEPGSSVPCTAKVGKERLSFSFDINDPEGGFSITEDD